MKSKERRYERPNRGEAHETDRGKNHHRFRTMAMKREPLSSEVFDMEINYLMYALNEINKGKNPLNPPIDSEGKLVWIGHDSKEILYSKLCEGMVQENGLDADVLIKDKSINSNKIANKSVITNIIDDEAVTNEKIANGTITGDKIKDGAVPFNKMTGKINSENIANNAIGNKHIKNDAITGDKILNSIITNEKIANNTVTGSKIANNTVTGSKIANNTVTGSKIANNTITGDKILNNAIKNSHIANNTITGNKIANNTITGNKIANNAITADKIQSISANKISGNIPRAKYADRSGYADQVNNLNNLNGHLIKSIRMGFVYCYARTTDEKTYKYLQMPVITGINNTKTHGKENYQGYIQFEQDFIIHN